MGHNQIAGSKQFWGDNYFNACLVVVNSGHGKSSVGDHPSVVVCGFFSEKPI